MPIKSRPDPVIPDHVILRKIGGGAYGEVWLARGVTGALRAVKVVSREDFEDERGFEREFEGILKFEPISRDHPGLVNILHVGRSADEVSFYYYVMEIGDDVRTGREINPIEYEPRTLRPDAKTAVATRLDLPLCIEVGLRLAEALHHLHERGLAHRDVKPANVIFVNGKAKLADIGLVAPRGQRTFVGTEGFVPPEGPGSTQADVYSLGKVLYEIVTGKDRLDFPELPDDLPLDPDRKRWVEFNRIICDICEPRVSKRRITTAAELADALRLLQRGKRRPNRVGAAWLTSAVLLAFAGWLGWEPLKDSGWLAARLPPPSPPPVAVPPPTSGLFRVASTPDSADVLDASGKLVGTTPTETMSATVGDIVTFTVQKVGYRTATLTARIGPGAAEEPQLIYQELEIFSPPQRGAAWLDHHGYSYQPIGGEHVSIGLVEEDTWREFQVEAKRAAEGSEAVPFSQHGQPATVMICTPEEAGAFCKWLRTAAIAAGYLTEDHEVLPLMEPAIQGPEPSTRARQAGFQPFRVNVRLIDYASIELTSSPPGAEVYLNGAAVGVTDAALTVPKIKPGEVELILVREGYKPHTEKLTVKPGQRLALNVPLEQNQGVVFGRAWENGIGMKFVPLGPDLMVAVWETRVRDFDWFVRETEHPKPPPPAFEQGAEHPVVFVSRIDASAFCDWLTQRERKPGEERIAASHAYRLPTDVEWSAMAGLREAPGLSPSWRDAHKGRTFPWGDTWPPPHAIGNFADEAAASKAGLASERTIPGYDDGFGKTAPVGSFPPSALGLCDLSGNAYEWVADDYSIVDPTHVGVLRGGGWTSYQAEHLHSGSRYPQAPDA
ncbi:MAG: hypothetical protein RLZZ522_1919, partial [Verrucomicrobiota bacterium]